MRQPPCCNARGSRRQRHVLRSADIRRLRLRSESVDVVVCGLALTHFEHLGAPDRRAGPRAATKGAMVISDLNPLAVATGGQAYFTASDGLRHMARNHVHWPRAYAEAFRSAGLAIDRLEELFVDEAFLQEMATPEIRTTAHSFAGTAARDRLACQEARLITRRPTRTRPRSGRSPRRSRTCPMPR
jgi:hypothetical protein